MRLEVEIKNYRCFPDERPARIVLGDGFTGIVGMNNSGKSALLKLFHELKNLFSGLTNQNNLLSALLGNPIAFGGLRDVKDTAEIYSNLNSRDLFVTLKLRQYDEAEAPDFPPPPELTVRMPRNTDQATFDGSVVQEIGSQTLDWTGTTLRIGNQPRYDFRPWITAFSALGSSIYVSPFRNAVNAGAGDLYGLPVGSGFIGQWDQWKAGNNKAQNRAALSLQQEIRRIFGFEQLDINASYDSSTLQIIIDGRSYRLDEVGGGLTHFVMVLAWAAITEPSFIFIDEPELNLHPSLQLDFLTTLAGYSSVGVAFATHSIGLARAAADDVFSVRRLRGGESDVKPLEATPRYSEFLGELSLSGYQELGFKSVLLVEGTTEVRVFQRLLREYGIEHDIVLLPLGGSSLIRDGVDLELEEIKRITPEIAAIIDSERDGPGQLLPAERQAFVEVCSQAAIRCHILDRRALENYFTDRAIKAAFGDNFTALGEFDSLANAEPGWAKNQNWRIAAEMTEPELAGTDLGEFLDSLADA